MQGGCHRLVTLALPLYAMVPKASFDKTAHAEGVLPDEEDLPSPLNGYVVSFAHFHERGLMIPAHTFLQGLLHYYKIKLHHLNPNRI